MVNGSRRAYSHARQRSAAACRLAGGAAVLYLFPFLFPDGCNCFFRQRIVFVGSQFQEPWGADRDTVATAITLIRVDADKKFAGAVLIAVIGDHYAPFCNNVSANNAAPSAPAIWLSYLVLTDSMPSSFSNRFTIPGFLAIPPVIKN